MDKMDVFNKVSSHLLLQMRQARDPGLGGCRYRQAHVDDDYMILKCAVGCLIKDEHYHSNIEGIGVTSLETRNGKWSGTGDSAQALAQALNSSGVPTYKTLLVALQEVHDCNEPHQWAYLLERIKVRLEVGEL